MKSRELKRAKQQVRRRVLAARDALSAQELSAAADAVAERFLALPDVAGARTVMVFSSFGSEVPMDPLIARLCDAGITVGLPRIAGEELQAWTYRPGDATTRTSFGALEPAAGAPVDPAAIDVIVTPAVAFDRAGRRIGYGGGFYDRYFPRTRPGAVRIGVGVALQVVDEDLPAGHFDLRVHVIVTPDETIACPR